MDIKLISHLDERAKRLFLATRANHLSKHGVSLVATASGVDRKTIYKGIHELNVAKSLQAGRIGNVGGGRKKLLQKAPRVFERM